MKTWIVAALLTGLVVVPMMIRNRFARPFAVKTDGDEKRYDIEEYIADEEL